MYKEFKPEAEGWGEGALLGILIAVGFLAIIFSPGCVSFSQLEPSITNPISACIVDEQQRYERVTIIGDNKEGDWLLVKPDSSDRSVQNVVKSKVRLMGCPQEGIVWQTDSALTAIR